MVSGTHQVAKKFSLSTTIFTNTFVESTTMFTKVTPFLQYTGITLSCQLKKETRTVCNTADLAVEEADESGNLATVHETGIDPNELDDQMKTRACLFLEQ